jgi:3',5'-cyclic AMP phosphodiesterase CpdA
VLNRYPIYPVPGNHEYYADAFFEDQPYYFHVFPPLVDPQSGDIGELTSRKWYAIELTPIQILMLDSQLFWRGEGRSEQTAWLAERLEDDRFQLTIPIMHVPPFTSGIYPNDGRVVRVDWVPLFESGRVPLVLSGHDHNYQRLRQNEITYIVTGGGSSILYPMGTLLDQSQYFAQRTHFVLLEFQPDHVKLSAITPTGEILDQAVVEYPN